VKFSLTLGKSTKVWFSTKVCFDAFTRHIRLHNVGVRKFFRFVCFLLVKNPFYDKYSVLWGFA